MTEGGIHPNLNPRPLSTWILGAILRPWLPLLRARPAPDAPRLTVFQSYSVGDVFMALPAIHLLARAVPLRVVCRRDCLEIFRDEGLDAVAFDNPYSMEQRPRNFFKTLRSAWTLRGKLGREALDFDADSRTGFWLKIGGAGHLVSYRRARAAFFDEALPFPPGIRHQGDRNLAVARAYLKRRGLPVPAAEPPPEAPTPAPGAPWIVSCWTRLPVKNWPLEKWDAFLESLTASGVPLTVLAPPDGDAAYQAFERRWSGRVPFLRVSLNPLRDAVRGSAGVLVLDNFVGHMAAYYGKPVLWVNGSSDPTFVKPQGPHTVGVQYDPMPCRPCHGHCVNPDFVACMKRLPVDDVRAAFDVLRAA